MLVLLKVTIGDDFPQLICQECFELLEKIIIFRKTCVENEEKLFKIYNEEINKAVILENTFNNSSPLQPKIEAFENELSAPIEIIQNPIKTEADCLILKNEVDGGKDVIESDPDYNTYLSDYSDSDSEPLINLKIKEESNQTKIKKKRKQYSYECEFECGRVITSYSGYEQHLRYKHKAKLKSCKTCPKQSYSDKFFQKHTDKHISLTCEYCQKMFHQQKTFDDHLLTHGVNKPYACLHCDGYFQCKSVSIFNLINNFCTVARELGS